MIEHLRHLRQMRAAMGDAAPPPPPPIDCAADPIEGIKRMFVDQVQFGRIKAGQDPARRPVFLRLHGVAHARFEVVPGLPDDLRVGVFGQQGEYTAWVRFSSDLPDGRPDLKSTVGIGIKLFGVDGEKLLPPDQDASTHDFILQNFDVFFVDTAKDMCEFTQASLTSEAAFNAYIKAHPKTGQLLNEMEKVVPTVLGATYHSSLPYRFGEGRYVKYSLVPETVPGEGGPAPDFADPYYMHADLRRRLREGESRFRFCVQFQTDDRQMPLDRATVRWSTEASPPVHVATLVVPAQDVGERGNAAYGENLAYNPWHALAAHEPMGSIADARREVYRASAELRRNVNGTPLGEPAEPRPTVAYPAAKDTRIVRAAIHPAIGVARLGNSEEFFVGPEVAEPLPKEHGFYRDGTGALKRQAARFRLYGYNAAGELVRELTPDWADVHWSVHVANRKASWYDWVLALDIPEAASLQVPLRNAKVTGKAREQLTVDGARRTIEGKGTYGSEYRFEGAFQGTPVYLGELRTDAAGRLLFLGGMGKSASPTGEPIYDTTRPNAFINADGWYDDASDGPVTAEVTIDGRPIPVDPAWVVTAPPNYAPDVVGVRTLYDLLVDLYVRSHWMEAPKTVSFTEDVYPVLQRMAGLQWVNRGFATQFGWGGPNDFMDGEFVARLARDPKAGGFDTWGELRRQVFNAFRAPEPADANLLPWPWIYGDADASDTGPSSPRINLSLTDTQYAVLRRWAAGDFVADWGAPRTVYRDLAQVPLAQQPAMLDRAALHFCLADAFHPGCEVTWPIRHLSMYTAPFRIRHRPAGTVERDYGPTLTQAVVLSPEGPLWEQGPGDLTRWMGLPWQEDTAYCRSGYDRAYDPYLPTFWPARVPNQVLTAADYAVVTDPDADLDARRAAFSRRASWTRLLGEKRPAQEQMMHMVEHFADLGVVEVRPGVPGSADFPPVMMVESAVGVPAGTVPFSPKLMMAAPALDALGGAAPAPAAPPAAAEDGAQGGVRRRFTGRGDFVRLQALPDEEASTDADVPTPAPQAEAEPAAT